MRAWLRWALAMAAMVAGLWQLVPVPAPEAGGRIALSAGEAEEAARRLALQVHTTTCAGAVRGSGFAAGYTTLVTNQHVVAGGSDVRFIRHDGLSLEAGVTAAAHTQDLVIVTLDRPIPDVVTLAERDPSPGQPVLVAGFPFGGPLQLTRGQVLDYVLERNGELVLRLTAAVAPGSSGSPVFDDSGQVVGVIYATEITTGHALAVPITALRSMLADPPQALPAASC